VVCLFEASMDTHVTFALIDHLKESYAHFYWTPSGGVSVSSGIFIASQFEVLNPEFTPFPKEMLVGRTKNCNKGVLTFELASHGSLFALVAATHAQHSEEVSYPTEEEITAREMEMTFIVDRLKLADEKAVVLTGDLNLDFREFYSSTWAQEFDVDMPGRPTWLGDKSCALLMGRRRFSFPCILDYTLVKKGSVNRFKTTLIDTTYNPDVFSDHALSDHRGLLTQFSI